MNTVEFSNEFDVSVDSYRRFKGFDSQEILDSIEFSEYEKSVFLTEAQNQIVVELYSGRNSKGASFEGTEELRECLRNIIREATLSSVVESRSKSKLYKLPVDLMFITFEEAVIDDDDAGCLNGTAIGAVPVTHDEIAKALKNPFRKPSKDRVLRIDIGPGTIEVYSLYNIKEYNIKYLKKPNPIVLGNFSEVTVDGVNEVSECELDSMLHRTILDRAVLLAMQSKGYGSSNEDNK